MISIFILITRSFYFPSGEIFSFEKLKLRRKAISCECLPVQKDNSDHSSCMCKGTLPGS